MTREKSPWDKSIHYKIHAVLYSNTFRIIDDISSVCRCLFASFFLPEHNSLPKQLNAMDTYAEGNLKSGVLYAKFKISIDE